MILYTIVSLFLLWLIVILLTTSTCFKEGLRNINSPLYSHTVNLPINDPVSCKNFCGPQSQCAITREQCTSDIDCQGCNPGPPPENKCITNDVDPYDDGGKLGQNQLQYSPLTTGYNNHRRNFEEAYPGSKNSEIKQAYRGVDRWEKSFNDGLKLYNDKQKSKERNGEGISDSADIPDNSKLSYYEPKYPMTRSATGLFYETTPPASNS